MQAQPFECRFQGCTASYQRKEHRRRHETQHTQDQGFKCATCGQQFARSDTLRRHRQQRHGVQDPPRIKYACVACRKQKTGCRGGPPCSNCLHRGIECSLSLQEDEPATERNGNIDSLAQDSPTQLSERRSEKERHYLSQYFRLFHPHWSFIHQGSFSDHAETPLLVQSMIVIGLWLSNEDKAKPRAIALHNVLKSAIQDQKGLWDASVAEEATASCTWPIPTYQAVLLHIIFALLSKPSGPLGLDLKPSLSPPDADILDRLVASCKRLGMFYYPNMLARYVATDIPSYVWVGIEEVKRFNLALFRACNACSNQRTSVNEGKIDETSASSRRLRAEDLQFPLPRNDPLWLAMEKEDWSAAAAEDVDSCSLADTLESEWISKSANVLELDGT
ncbi:hypothetical protein BJX70DRAFT_339546 [Aspergillus crustosus]